MNTPFRFPEFAYCWFSNEEKLSTNDDDKWAFYRGLELLVTQNAAAWILYQLLGDVQGEHVNSFLFQSMTVLKKHMGSSWVDKKFELYSDQEGVTSKPQLNDALKSLGTSFETPPPRIFIPIDTARPVINELFYGDFIKSSSTIETLHQQLKDLTVSGSVELFQFLQMMLKSYLVHMQKQFTLIRLMFETSSSGSLTDFYNEAKIMEPSVSSDGIIGFRELYKILKTLWPNMSMMEAVLVYKESFDAMYPPTEWGKPSPDGISFESFLIAADRRSLFSRMRS